ncbi:MAG: hypothetical protein KAQ98_01685 [Bacteriovoracaceae bacterium]|nr:hypothetical protein [Bacteriovoracaceae bacterium]
MKNPYLEKLQKNYHLFFSGSVNIVHQKTSKFYGRLFQYKGCLVGARFLFLKGRGAVNKILSDFTISPEKYELVNEPELLDKNCFEFNYTFNELLVLIRNLHQEVLQSRSIRPCLKNQITVNKLSNTSSNISLDKTEFQVLCSIIEHQYLDKIYRLSALYEPEITFALHSLKNKGLINLP